MTDPIALQALAGGSAPRVDTPAAGFYQMRLVKGGIFVGVRIWRGFGLQDGIETDLGKSPEHIERGYHWRCLIDGVEQHIWKAWPQCSGDEITEAEYRFLLAQRQHATQYQPDSPFANPRKKVDWLTVRHDFSDLKGPQQ